MNTKTFTIGQTVYLAFFSEQNLAKSGVLSGIVTEDHDTYCIIDDHGVWTKEKTHATPLSAADHVREMASYHAGWLATKTFQTNQVISNMSSLWNACYNNSEAGIPKDWTPPQKI